MDTDEKEKTSPSPLFKKNVVLKLVNIQKGSHITSI